MKTWINDGYTRRAEIGRGVVYYRPMVRWERDVVRGLRKDQRVTEDSLAQLFTHFLRERVLYYDGFSSPIKTADMVEIFRVVCGSDKEEQADIQALVDYLRVKLGSPELAVRSCSDCLEYIYDEVSGRPILRDGEKCQRGEIKPPCQLDGVGCPKGSPEGWSKVTETAPQTYEHFLTCETIGQFPDDEIVKRNVRIIRKAIKEFSIG